MIIPIYFKQARLCSLLHTYTRKCEISKPLNLCFSTVWRIILSEQKLSECNKINQVIELHDLMHSLPDLVTCLPEGLPICQICACIFRGFARCSSGNLSKSGKKVHLQKKRSHHVCADPKPMDHVMHAQTSRQDGGFSAMFISLAMELCDVSRFVLH